MTPTASGVLSPSVRQRSAAACRSRTFGLLPSIRRPTPTVNAAAPAPTGPTVRGAGRRSRTPQPRRPTTARVVGRHPRGSTADDVTRGHSWKRLGLGSSEALRDVGGGVQTASSPSWQKRAAYEPVPAPSTGPTGTSKAFGSPSDATASGGGCPALAAVQLWPIGRRTAIRNAVGGVAAQRIRARAAGRQRHVDGAARVPGRQLGLVRGVGLGERIPTHGCIAIPRGSESRPPASARSSIFEYPGPECLGGLRGVTHSYALNGRLFVVEHQVKRFGVRRHPK